MGAQTAYTLDGADWTSLVYGVEQGDCTLMLGPDAVTGRLDGELLPVHVAFATFVKTQLGPAGEYLDPSKPWTVAQAAVAQQDGRTLRAWVSEFYKHFEGDFEVLRELATMPFPLVINTSPGLSVHRIFSEVKPGTVSDFYDRTAPARPDLPDPSVDAPVVYNLYGSLERPPSLILSESDRLDFVEAVVSGRPSLPVKLRSLLGEEERSFLFLGFELGQWQFQLLLHTLGKNKTRAYKSFAFERGGDEPDEDTQDFYLKHHKIHFVSGEVKDFVHELRGRVCASPAVGAAGAVGATEAVGAVGVAEAVGTVAAAEVVGAAEAAQRTVPPDAPVVFICHASEDKEFAQTLADDLESNGIGTWLDKYELAGGDEWDATIRRTIRETVDYVVVLQSAHLLAKDHGYVNREIKLAIDRQFEYRSGRFVIPVCIDDAANRLDLLDDWQSIDLTGGVDELVRAIWRDRHKQGRREG